MGSLVKLTYSDKNAFTYDMPGQAAYDVFTHNDLDEIFESCESVKDDEIIKLKNENRKLRKLNDFLNKEIQSLELITAVNEKAIPLKEIVDEFTSTPDGRNAWEDAWKEQFDEWKALAESGRISRVKYFRLINGMDQKTLAKKLGTAQPNISRLEKPGYNVPIRSLEKLARIFNVKKGDLIGD